MPSPLDVLCSACFAAPNSPCTAPTGNDKRREVSWVHHVRDAALADELRHKAKVQEWVDAGVSGNTVNPVLRRKIESKWGRE